MKVFAYLFPLLAVARARDIRDSHVTRSGSELLLDGQRWTAAGANVYWLGLDENVIPPAGEPFYAPYNASYPTKGRITEVFNTLKTLGANAARVHTLGVSVGNPLSLWPELGKTNEKAFESMDWTVYEARRHGIRLFVPLTDNYDYYHGGKFVFLRWRGINISSNAPINRKVQEFYTNKNIISDFKNYTRILLTHVNPYTNISYADDPTIFAYETGNELGGPVFGDMDVPASWTREIADHLKQLAPEKLVVDGTYGVNKTNLNITNIDILSNHYYPVDIKKLKNDVALVESVNKVYFAGEYQWTLNPQATPLNEFFDYIEGQQNKTKPVIAGDHFWSLFGHNVPNCTQYVDHNDGLALQYGNPRNSANITSQVSRIRQHLFRIKGAVVDQSLPPVPCPGPD